MTGNKAKPIFAQGFQDYAETGEVEKGMNSHAPLTDTKSRGKHFKQRVPLPL